MKLNEEKNNNNNRIGEYSNLFGEQQQQLAIAMNDRAWNFF